MKDKIIFLLLLSIPYFFVFKSVFLGGELSFGDAPYFYSDNLKELYSLPLIWDIRYLNFGGLQAGTLWLYLPTFLFGLLNKIFGLDNDFLIRLVFILPSSILGLIGVWKLISLFSKNSYGKFLGIFFYIFNTYYILLIDGGQIGVALAFGLFPWVILSIINYQEKDSTKNFIIALIATVLLSNVDIRIVFLAFFYLIIFTLASFENIRSKFKKNLKILPILIITLLLNSFWIYPLIMNANSLEHFLTKSVEINFTSILNSLLLYQPHFPTNDFGKTVLPPSYFVFLPIILFSGLFFIKRGKSFYISLSLIFLSFAFLAKGKNAPFGEFYKLIDYIPYLGMVFRDSSKFFIPEIMTASLLITLSFEMISQRLNKRNKILLFIAAYVFFVILISPALFNSLSGGLNNNVDMKSFEIFYRKVSNEDNFFRTLWFDEKPPLGISTWSNPAISANTLYQKRPFADMIDGSYDLTGYLNSSLLQDWLNITGVRFILFPKNERKKTLTEEQKIERKVFLNFINNLGFKKLKLGTSFPIYEVKGGLPHLYSVKNIQFVSGGDEIYSTFQKNNISIVNNPLIFIDDEKFDFYQIEKNYGSEILIQGNKNDLIFSYLRRNMLDISKGEIEWADYHLGDYLTIKAKLLENRIRSLDYDFGKGMFFSTVHSEKIKFFFKNKNPNEKNILAVRYLTSSQSAGINLKLDSKNLGILKNKNNTRFEWKYFNLNMKEGLDFELENLGGVVAVNALMVITNSDFEAATHKIDTFLSKAAPLYINKSTDFTNVKTNENVTPLSNQMINPTEYIVIIPKGNKWVIFSDSFDKGWVLENSKCKISPLPIYSFINGFYIEPNCEDKWQTWRLYHKSQEHIKVGIFLSTLFSSTLIIGLIGAIYYKNGFHRKNN